MYFYGHDGMSFYCNIGSFYIRFIRVSTLIICPVEVSEGLQ